MIFDSLTEIFAPMQIALVLVIALIVFGPKRLPEIGKQLGMALRDLKKAGNDVIHSLNVDHDPEPTPNAYYSDTYASSDYQPYSPPALVEAPPDLTDYTIAGQPVQNTVAYSGSQEPAALTAQYAAANAEAAASSAPAPAEFGAPTSAASESQKEGTQNV